MKFPSIKNLADGITFTINRFPFEIFFAFAGTISATIHIELQNINRVGENWTSRLTMIGNLGLVLSLATTLFVESKGISGVQKIYCRVLAAVIAVSFLMILNPDERASDDVRFFLLALCFHLLVAYAAFTANGHFHGFWQFNKTLFLRFLTSVLYGVVLYLGLAAAIGAMNFLFNFKFEWDTFAILWVWIVGVFSTMFFLAGVPGNLTALDSDVTYPKGLKIFTQYVLIPLATVYVIILLAYEIKILLAWNLPKGLVSNLILGYAVFGILSLLLVYPIRNREENKWLKTYARSFYFLMLPLLALLFMAVGVRVSRYGITEYRYFLILLALWLTFISIYFLAFKKQNIKLIPISLSVLTLFSIYGPQSAFSVSLYSQRRLLINILKKNNAYLNDKFIPVDSSKMSQKDGDRASQELRYLVYEHGLGSLQPYFNKNLNAISDSIDRQKDTTNPNFTYNRYEATYKKLEWVKTHLNLGRFSEYNYTGTTIDSVNTSNATIKTASKSYRFRTKNDVIDVRAYDYLVDANGLDTTATVTNGIRFQHKFLLYNYFILRINNEEVKFKMDELARKLLKLPDLNNFYSKKENANSFEKLYWVPSSQLTLVDQATRFKVTFLIDNFGFNVANNERIEPTYVSGTYFIKTLH